jgi:hypothetical protein
LKKTPPSGLAERFLEPLELTGRHLQPGSFPGVPWKARLQAELTQKFSDVRQLLPDLRWKGGAGVGLPLDHPVEMGAQLLPQFFGVGVGHRPGLGQNADFDDDLIELLSGEGAKRGS